MPFNILSTKSLPRIDTTSLTISIDGDILIIVTNNDEPATID